jgi:hypothetical protein
VFGRSGGSSYYGDYFAGDQTQIKKTNRLQLTPQYSKRRVGTQI